MREILEANGFYQNPKNGGFCPVCGGGAWSYIKGTPTGNAECLVNIKNTTAGQTEKGTGMLKFRGSQTRVTSDNILTVLQYQKLAESIQA